MAITDADEDAAAGVIQTSGEGEEDGPGRAPPMKRMVTIRGFRRATDQCKNVVAGEQDALARRNSRSRKPMKPL